MIIYAIFLCFQFGQCQAVEPGRVDEYGDMHAQATYPSLEACKQAIHHLYYGVPVPEPDDQGHYPVQGGAWYVCLSRHVDTWQEP